MVFDDGGRLADGDDGVGGVCGDLTLGFGTL